MLWLGRPYVDRIQIMIGLGYSTVDMDGHGWIWVWSFRVLSCDTQLSKVLMFSAVFVLV